MVFIVRPASPDFRLASTRRPRRFAFLASTNTWNAYNAWGGRFQYTEYPDNTPELGFEWPNAQTRPGPPYRTVVVDDPIARGSYDSNARAMTRADLWILTWLEDAGYDVDVYTDADFHAGSFDPADFAGLILGTHRSTARPRRPRPGPAPWPDARHLVRRGDQCARAPANRVQNADVRKEATRTSAYTVASHTPSIRATVGDV